MNLENRKWLQRAFQLKPYFFSLLFILYIGLIQPKLMTLLAGSQNGSGNIFLGWGLLFIPLLEFAGIFSKLPVSNYFHSQNTDDLTNVNAVVFLFIINMVLHLGLGCLYMFVCFQVIQGVPLNDGTAFYTVLAIVLMFVVIAKEAFIIVIIMSATPLPGVNLPSNNKFDQWLFTKVNQNTIRHLSWGDFIQDMAGDGFLLLFSAISFTVMWNFIVSLNPPEMIWPNAISELFGVLLYFLMIYLPLRASSFPFEMNIIHSKKQWIIYTGSILFAALMSILPFLI